MYNSCYIECVNDLWYIMWPDGTKAWNTGYKTRACATRTHKFLVKNG
jgi:hypothetical protein